MMSLSDRTKSFIVYSAVVVVAVCNIVFGLIWLNAPAPQTRPAAAPAATSPIAAGQTAPANADGLPTGGNDASAQTKAPIARSAGEAAPPKCNVSACAGTYRSFRASDCTYQPVGGPRRICTK
jgi:hypothetical protein